MSTSSTGERPNPEEAGPSRAGLRVGSLRVRGFRALKDLCIDLDPRLTVMIGENNTGKTSLLEALETAFGLRRGAEDDLHLDRDDRREAAFIVDLTLVPEDGQAFSDDLRVVLGNAIQRGPEDRECVAIRFKGEPAADRTALTLSRVFLQGWSGCKVDASEATELPQPPVDRRVMDLLVFSLLDASRDLVAQLRDRRSAWGRLVADMDIDEQTGRDIERALADLSNRIIGGSSVLDRLRTDLRRLEGALGPSVADVALAPLPHRVEELARAIDVLVTAPDSAPIPMRLQGMGSRSLAALMIFQAFIDLRVGVDLPLRPHALNAFEEPEAHLHPQAQRAVLSLLELVPGQNIVSTHSPYVVSGADIGSIRVLRREGPSTIVKQSTRAFDAEDLVKVQRLLQQENGEILFARVVVFSEGASEKAALPILLKAEWPDRALEGMGISLVGVSGMGHAKSIVPSLEDLGISWLLFADGDQQGERDVAAIGNALGRKLDRGSAEVVMLAAGDDFESFLVKSGFQDPLRRAVEAQSGPDALPDHEKRNPALTGNPDELLVSFLRKRKGSYGAHAAEEILSDILNGKVTLPPELRELCVRIRGLL